MPGRVLIIEHDPVLAGVIERVVVKAGYTAIVARDLSHASMIAASVLPDLAICGARPLDGSGISLLAFLRDLDRHVDVILSTGAIPPDVAADVTEGRASDFLEAPFSPDDVRVALYRAFKRRAAASRASSAAAGSEPAPVAAVPVEEPDAAPPAPAPAPDGAADDAVAEARRLAGELQVERDRSARTDVAMRDLEERLGSETARAEELAAERARSAEAAARADRLADGRQAEARRLTAELQSELAGSARTGEAMQALEQRLASETARAEELAAERTRALEQLSEQRVRALRAEEAARQAERAHGEACQLQAGPELRKLALEVRTKREQVRQLEEQLRTATARVEELTKDKAHMFAQLAALRRVAPDGPGGGAIGRPPGARGPGAGPTGPLAASGRLPAGDTAANPLWAELELESWSALASLGMAGRLLAAEIGKPMSAGTQLARRLIQSTPVTSATRAILEQVAVAMDQAGDLLGGLGDVVHAAPGEPAAADSDVLATLEPLLSRLAGPLATGHTLAHRLEPAATRVALDPPSLSRIVLAFVAALTETLPAGETIEVSTEVCADAVRIRVGVGARAGAGRGEPPPGAPLPLGVSICERLVKSLGGTLEVTWQAGRVAAIAVLLPARPAATTP
jgi:DNA-binding response OmpR family regulator